MTNLEQERITLSIATDPNRGHPVSFPARHSTLLVAAIAAAMMVSGTASAQSPRPPAAAPQVPATVTAPALGSGPDLQGLWDFTMRVGDRTSPGFFALGPVEQGWAGSITMYLTNTLAIRAFTVVGDSVRMVVASREGDVLLRARLTDDGRKMEGIVDYHGGARLPILAMRRVQPVLPR